MSGKNFWNDWDFKSILQIATIVIGFIIGYVKLEAKVEHDKELYEKDIAYLKQSITKIEIQLDRILSQKNEKLENNNRRYPDN